MKYQKMSQCEDYILSPLYKMTDLEVIDKIGNREARAHLTSLESIASFLNTDVDDPMVYCVFKQCNKDKLDAIQIESVDRAIHVLKKQQLEMIRRNDEYMDKHL
jgi:hypothetical protein